MTLGICIRSFGTMENEEITGHRITFHLSKSGRARITVYDEHGRTIRDLALLGVRRIDRTEEP